MRTNKKRQKEKLEIKRILSVVLAVVLLLFSVLPVYADSADNERQTVRVGFFAWDGYHVEDERGIKSGYGYDFLKMAENYNNWNYEYVGYDKSWADMLTMLDAGEIDMVTSAQKTPEWEALYDYSDSAIGTSATILTVRNGDERYTIGDTSTYAGIRVGMLENSSRNARFAEYAAEKDFTYIPVYYKDMEAMQNDFHEGKQIDAILSSNLRTMDNETILEEFDPVDFYVIVKKGNTELLEEINNAIRQMDMNSSGWRLTLKNQYFSDAENNVLSFNKSELEYLDHLKETNRTFQVVTNPDLKPYSYFENGEAEGIAPRIFEEAAKRVGLQYEYIQTDTYKEYNDLVRSGGADIDLTCYADYGLAEFHGLDLTNAYMSTSMALLTLKKSSEDIKKIAVLPEFANNTTFNKDLMADVVYEEHSTIQEGMQSILDGETDGMYTYTYAAQQLTEQDSRNRLRYTILPEYTINLAMGVNETEDYRLISVLNEGIRNVKGAFAQKVMQEEVEKVTLNNNALALIYDHPGMAVGGLAVVLISLFLLVFFVINTAHARKEHRNAQELARFMGYVCETCESVLEVNLDTLECRSHTMEDGVLISKDMPYEFANYANHNDEIYPEDFDRLTNEEEVQSFWDVLKKEDGYGYFEARAKAKNGEFHWFAYTIRPIPRDRIHPNNFILFKKDIDQVKRKEEDQRQLLETALESAKTASEAKGQFLSRMSHEIRTPLNAVIGYMDIAKDSSDNPSKMLHCVENSDMAARHLLSIINDVLDISSIESGKMKIANREFDLKKQMTTISTLFFNQAKEKKVRFDVKLEDITEEWVVGDELRVNQILMNLLSNAVKFTPENGNILLKISQIGLDDKSVYMKFEVKDSGIGMSEEYQKRLFQPFEQESAQTAQKYGGSGLGLSITYQLIQLMGGTIDVSSKPGTGTTFIVSLYFGRSQDPHKRRDIQHDYSHVRALVVDDEKSTCEYMKNLLKRCRVKCDIATSGEAAIRQIRRRMDTEYKYDLCIMDWNMPDMNGIQVAKQIREECKSDIPIIIATAYDVTEFEDQARELGITRVIAKPLFQSTMFDLLVDTYGKYEPTEDADEGVRDLSGLHVLLAEDNEMNMEIAVDILTKSGIKVAQAVDGGQVYEMFIQSDPGTYDAILMDVQMPVMNGYEATRKIRTSGHPEASTMPIIAMTANAFAEDITAALSCGMNAHIAKPIDYDKLFQVLGKYKKGAEGHE